jgi:nucleoside-diphosphate-sugar epimerase
MSWPSKKQPLCAITGASGYVGGCIKNCFKRSGWEILELTRRADRSAPAVPFQLGANLPPDTLTGATALVHCAYDFRPLYWNEVRSVNVEGARRVFDAARAAGIERTFFVSSISAYPGCRSLYGKAKLEIEDLALARGVLAVRAGLVYGNHPQGLFGKLVEQVRNSSMLPIFGRGSQIQFLVHEEDLAAFCVRHAEGKIVPPLTCPITAAHDRPWPLRELLAEIGRGLNKRLRFFPLPWRLIWLALKTAESCGMHPKFRSDSLVSLMHQNPAPDFSLNAAAGLVCRPFQIETVKLQS